jgi:hypothetical protein
MALASTDGEGEGANDCGLGGWKTSDGVRRVGRYIREQCCSCLGRDKKKAGKAV